MNENDWKELLGKWNKELLAYNLYLDFPNKELSEEILQQGWLGYPGATEEQIAQSEARIGKELPISYREFLKFTNGWRRISPFINKLWSTNEVNWFSVRNQGWIDAFIKGMGNNIPFVSDEEYFVYDENQNWLKIRVEYLATALEISDRGDDAICLLNPQVITPEGEWEAWFFANWLCGARRYKSFWELMQAEYVNFLLVKESVAKATPEKAESKRKTPALFKKFFSFFDR